MIRKMLKVILLTLLTYLLQATLAQELAISGAAPNLALGLVAVIAVCMGRKYAFLMSLTVGYLLQLMLAPLDYFTLILYPVSAMLGALLFSDKSERKLEEERTLGKRSTQLNPHLRTILCAAVSAAVYEGVHLIYTYLSGISITAGHISRAWIALGYTALLAGLLQFPVRWWLGVYKLPKAR